MNINNVLKSCLKSNLCSWHPLPTRQRHRFPPSFSFWGKAPIVYCRHLRWFRRRSSAGCDWPILSAARCDWPILSAAQCDWPILCAARTNLCGRTRWPRRETAASSCWPPPATVTSYCGFDGRAGSCWTGWPASCGC